MYNTVLSATKKNVLEYRVCLSFHFALCGEFLTLKTGISANFDVWRNVVPPWRVRQARSGSYSMMSQNVDIKQSRKVASSVCLRHILHIFRQEWEKRRESVQDLQYPRLGKPRRGLQILDTRMGFPRPSLNVVLDSIILKSVFWYSFCYAAMLLVCEDICLHDVLCSTW